MSEELYNSSDYCSLAEQYEELKKENAELARDKDYLMNLFMERSEYVFNVVANMKIESLTQKCKALEADYEVSNREMLIIQVEIGKLKSELARRDEKIAELEAIVNPASFRKFLVEQIKDPELAEAYVKACIQDTTYKELLARRDEIITRLKEDAERLASTYVVEVFPHEWVCRGGCHHWARFGEQIDHAPDCPITLHRALTKELE